MTTLIPDTAQLFERTGTTALATPARNTWALTGVVAGATSLVAAIVGLGSLEEDQYLAGVPVIGELERGSYHVAFLLGLVGVFALLVAATGWRRWATQRAGDDIAAGTIATALQATATVNIIGYSLAGALALYLPGGMDEGTMADESLFVNFAYLDFGTLFGWWGAFVAAGCVAILAVRGLLPRWMGVVSVLFLLPPLVLAVVASLPGMPGLVMPIWLVVISIGMARTDRAATRPVR